MPACQAKLVCQCEWECDPSSWDRQVDGSPLQGLADGLIYRFPGMPCAATSYTKKIERKMEASKQSDVKTKMKRCVSMWTDGARHNWQHWPSSVVLVMIDQGPSPRHVQVGHHARPWKRWDLVASLLGSFLYAPPDQDLFVSLFISVWRVVTQSSGCAPVRGGRVLALKSNLFFLCLQLHLHR
jgi:hypothetical protein